jgi:hypothetical protein
LLDTNKLGEKLFSFINFENDFNLNKKKFKNEIISKYNLMEKQSNILNEKINKYEIPFLYALPKTGFSDFLTVNNPISGYRILSVDGSQIDKIAYFSNDSLDFLVNIGTAYIDYKEPHKTRLDTKPIIYSKNYISELLDMKVTNREYDKSDLISSFRTYSEFNEANNLISDLGDDSIIFMDGGLVQWHLQDKPLEVKEFVTKSISELINSSSNKNIPIIGYISGTRASDVVNCLKIFNCKNNNFNCKNCDDEFCGVLNSIDDSFLFMTVKENNSIDKLFVSPIFQSTAKIIDYYNSNIYFFYIYNRDEFARVEITSNSLDKIYKLTTIIYDQIIKGFGYPTVLSEAHEMAVVTESDRFNFEKIIESMFSQLNINMKKRSKNMSKRMKYV